MSPSPVIKRVLRFPVVLLDLGTGRLLGHRQRLVEALPLVAFRNSQGGGS